MPFSLACQQLDPQSWFAVYINSPKHQLIFVDFVILKVMQFKIFGYTLPNIPITAGLGQFSCTAAECQSQFLLWVVEETLCI